MEDIHNFQGGLHSDFDSQNQPPNTYREAINWIRLEDGSLTNEKGTIVVPNYPSVLEVKGSVTLEEEVIFFSYGIDEDDDLPYSEIGVVSKVDGEWTYEFKLPTDDLGITEDSIIKAEARINYKGDRIVYFIDINGSIPARIVNLDALPDGDIDANTRLILESNLPVITVDSVTEDGNLPTGIYQFSARLLTASLNKTTPSLLTNIVPIVNESTGIGVESYDGALPQSNSFKSINLTISNIDSKFKFIEIIATTYDGLTNTVKSNVIGTKLITNTTMQFTYSSLDQNEEELTLDELTVSPVSLDNPSAITQKDGHLVLGNLKTKSFNPDFQYIANRITAKYIIKDLDYYEVIDVDTTNGIDKGGNTFSFKNYKGELYTTNYKGYQRDEVYSFAITPIYKNMQFGYSYHIPGSFNPLTGESQGSGGKNAADTVTKSMGFYKCQDEVYPDNYGYPTGNVSYHKFPTMDEESIFDNDTSKIRILGIKFENIDLSSLSQEEQDNIIGYAITRELRTESNKSILAQGIVNPLTKQHNDSLLRVVSPFAGKSNHDYALGSFDIDYFYNSVAFYSPETTIYNNPMIAATHIQPLGFMQGNSYMVGQKRDGDNPEEEYAHFFLNYTKFYTFNEADANHQRSAINRSTISYIANNGGMQSLPVSSGYSVDTSQTNGFLFLETETDVEVFQNKTTKDRINNKSEISYLYQNGSTSEVYLLAGGNIANNREVGETTRNLFNIIAERDNQYGGVLDKEYILVNYTLSLDNSIECYGGDTFINKTSLVSTTKAPVNNRDYNINFRTLSYFFCESTINTAYRHWIPDTTIPYYPKSKKFWTTEGDGILQVEPYYGHANGYNKQYSFDNILKKFYSKSVFFEEEVTEFSNRVIYSEQSIEGESFDAYRLFLTNNYHDIPKNKGAITNLFVHQNGLYIHTPQTLWKSSFNERVSQSSTAGEVVLGNGGIFPTPSIEMFPQGGGYAGSIDSLATMVTPYGTFFVDRIQKKIFLLGNSFEEVTSGISKFLITMFSSDSVVRTTFDYLNDRVLISNGTHTISYYPKLKSYTSLHSYLPVNMISLGLETFISSNGIYRLNVGDYGSYFDSPIENASITIISNQNPLVNKVYDNVRIDSTSSDSSDTFNSLTVYNEYESVTKNLVIPNIDVYDFIPQDTQVTVVKSNDEYKLSIPLTEDDSRFKSKWCGLTFTYNNSDNNKLVVKYLTVLYRTNSR